MISNHLVTAKDIIAEMFNKEAGKVVDECKMDVVYLYPPQPPSPVPEESEEGSSPRASSQLDNGGCSSSTYDSVPKASDESKEKHREASLILESAFNDSLTRERDTWLDVAQSLAQKVSSGDIVTRDDLSMLLDLLHNPSSELYLTALEVLNKISMLAMERTSASELNQKLRQELDLLRE